jgi:hypothetical protein
MQQALEGQSDLRQSSCASSQKVKVLICFGQRRTGTSGRDCRHVSQPASSERKEEEEESLGKVGKATW